MESDDNVSGEFQRSTRMPLDAVVRLHFQGTVAYQNGFAANVSATGMFVKHPAPPPLGTQLVFEFNLGAERKPVQGAGEVVWVRDKYLGPGQPAGVGIRFLQLDSQSRDHIAEALFEYLEQSLTEDSLLDSSGYSFATEPAPAPTAVAESFAPAAPASSVASAPPDFGDIYSDADAAPQSAAEAIDFSALERLPSRPSPAADFGPASGLPTAAPLAASGASPLDERRTFSVFSPLAEADSQTADIVREAMREEVPIPMMGAAASSEREGTRSWLWVLLALVVLGGGGFLAWQQWGADWLARRGAVAEKPAAPAPEPAPVRRPEPLNAVPGPDTTLAETVGVDSQATSPAAAPPQAAPAEAAIEEPSDVAAAASESAPPAAATPALAQAAAPAAAAAAADAPRPPAPAVAGTARAARLTGIDWRAGGDAAGVTRLVLVGDGPFATGFFSYSEIGGENPRVLIKLKGMESPYRGPAPRAPQNGGALVRGVRTGFHVTSSGNEIHVVVDLAKRGVKVVSLAPEAAGLALTLAP